MITLSIFTTCLLDKIWITWKEVTRFKVTSGVTGPLNLRTSDFPAFLYILLFIFITILAYRPHVSQSLGMLPWGERWNVGFSSDGGG